MRNYIARTDDGHDFGEVWFSSDNRAGSRANWLDARAALMKKKGYGAAKRASVIEVALADDGWIQTAPFVSTRNFEFWG